MFKECYECPDCTVEDVDPDERDDDVQTVIETCDEHSDKFVTPDPSDGPTTRVGHCKTDETDTYIGRGPGGRDMTETPVGERGWLGNPFVTEAAGGTHSRAESIDLFRDAFYDRVGADDEFRKAVESLAGETLGCWCRSVDDDAPACHGDVIAAYLNGEGAESITDAERGTDA